MKQPILSDLYTCQLLKLCYKLYRNRLPSYFEMFLPEYEAHRHNLRNDLIRLPAINYNLYFVHNTISTPYFHRQKNSTKKNIQQKLFT